MRAGVAVAVVWEPGEPVDTVGVALDETLAIADGSRDVAGCESSEGKPPEGATFGAGAARQPASTTSTPITARVRMRPQHKQEARR